MDLRISRAFADAIRAQAQTAAPAECCGLLLGDAATGRVDAIAPAANVAADPVHCFEIDPAALLAAHKAARTGGPQIVGHYHSHPMGEPVPSAVDAAMAQGEGEIWLIVGTLGRIGAWRATPDGPLHGRFAPVAISEGADSSLAPAAGDRH